MSETDNWRDNLKTLEEYKAEAAPEEEPVRKKRKSERSTKQARDRDEKWSRMQLIRKLYMQENPRLTIAEIAKQVDLNEITVNLYARRAGCPRRNTHRAKAG